MEIGKLIRLAPATWPGKELEVQPGDLSKLVPDGLGIAGPFPIRPWDDPFGPSPGRYYGYQARTGLPYLDAPIADAAGGTIYFDDSPRREDFDALLRLMGIRVPELEYLPQNDFRPVAREIAAARVRGVLSFVNGSASSCGPASGTPHPPTR